MVRQAPIVKDFTRTGTPDILGSLTRVDNRTSVQIAWPVSAANEFPQPPVLFQFRFSTLSKAITGCPPPSPVETPFRGATTPNGHPVRLATALSGGFRRCANCVI
jgi:hypothetical protein